MDRLPTEPEEWDTFDLEAWVRARIVEGMRPHAEAVRAEEEERILYGDPAKARATGILRMRLLRQK